MISGWWKTIRTVTLVSDQPPPSLRFAPERTFRWIVSKILAPLAHRFIVAPRA